MRKFIKKNLLVFIWLLSIVIILAFASILNYLWDSRFLIDFTSNWLATLLGVIIGVPVALWVSRYQEKKTEEEKKRKILELLREEINVNWQIIKVWFKKPITGEVFTLSLDIKVELWKSFSDGGELEWIKDTELYTDLSDAYYITLKIKNSADKYFQSTLNYSTTQGRIYGKHLESLIADEVEDASDIFGRVFRTIGSHLKSEKENLEQE